MELRTCLRTRRDPKSEGRGSKFRKPRTSDLEPSPFPLVSPVSPVLSDVQAIEVLLCRNSFPQPASSR